ncbi:MAG: OmpA family protein [Gammaproteobacteria bacterium]|nr:OmpA family protein [Gammaproteobacteria bacterium]
MRRNLYEDESNPERWMVSYADFITLLFGFFVVMYAISSVNDDKYKVLSATLAKAFDVETLSADAIQVGEPTQTASPHVIDLPNSTALADHEYGDTFIEDPVEAAQSMLGGFTDEQGVSIRSNNDWLELKLDAGVLFKPGQAVLSADAEQYLKGPLSVLQKSSNPITIEGYTDNVPSTSSIYPSNWELSAARASAVARYMVVGGVRPSRIAAVGYGENHPLATNATPQGRELNRRVVLVIARRTSISRNLNADPSTSAFAVLRSQAESSSQVVPTRTPDGGLLFSNVNETSSSE